MPVKLIDVELSEPLQPIWGMEGYDGANLLVRYHGRPIGWAYAVGSNRSFISPELVSQAIDHHLSWQCVEAVLGKGPNVIDQPSARLPAISVIICRGPAANRIDECLVQLRRLAYQEFEIIVVDYGPYPSAPSPGQHADVRHIYVDAPNLAVARNRGIAEARHGIVAFIDQDSYPDPKWLQVMGRSLSSRHIKAVCGLIVPTELETLSQHHWENGGYGVGRGLERRVVRRARLSDQQLLRAADFGSGGNMAFHRSVLEDLGGFDPRFSINAASGGSEVELLHRLVAAGHVLLYEPNALTWHRPPRDPHRVRRGAYERGISAGLYMLMCFRKGTVSRGALIRFLLQDWAWRRIGKRVLRPGKAPRSLVMAELAGALASPAYFWRARKRFGGLAAGADPRSRSLPRPANKREPQAFLDESSVSHRRLEDVSLSRIKIIRTWYPHWGAYSGINQYLRYINRGQYQISTLLVHENDSQFPIRSPRFREWLRYWCRKDDMAWYNLSDLRAEFTILKACIAERPDIVHYLDGEHAAQWIPRLSSLPPRMRPAFVVSYHQPPDVMEYAIRKEAFDRFDHVVAIAPEQMEFLHRRTSAAKISLILHGIDTEFFRPGRKTIRTDAIRCLSVGHNYRDYSTIRQVAMNLREHNRIEFHIVSPKPTGLEHLPNVVHHNDVDDQTLLKLYQDADILFLPLVKATANNALLEGIACGLPVISSWLPSVKAYLPGNEAILIDTKNPSDYTDAVLSLSRDDRRRQEMGAAARKRALELSWTNIAAQYEAIYSRLIGR